MANVTETTPVGDLATDVSHDDEPFDDLRTQDEGRDELVTRGAMPLAVDAFDRAWVEWERTI